MIYSEFTLKRKVKERGKKRLKLQLG